MSRATTFLTGVLVVLACAAGGFALRGALDGGGAAAPSAGRLPVTAVGASERFSSAAAASRAVPDDATLIATARGRSVALRTGGGRRTRTLHQRVFNGQRIALTFTVLGRRPGLLHVSLPGRPNQSSAWVRRHDVRLDYTRMRVVVRLREHRLDAYAGAHRWLRTRIAVGKALSPTPAGRYFVTDIVRPPDPKGFYGPFAIGLSAHSTVYTSFEGGDGQVGIHGTNAPGAIGSDVSHGCIRIANAVVRRLAARLPLGTPVVIKR